MKTLKSVLLVTIFVITSFGCATKWISTIEGGEYDAAKNETNYFVLPYGAVSIPGKWKKTRYASSSKQQFFQNVDSVSITIAFNRYDNFEFNPKGKIKGMDFINAFYKWETDAFSEVYGLKSLVIESDSISKFMIWRLFGEIELGNFDTYFLTGEKNGNFNNFSVQSTDKWTEVEKVKFLKGLYLD